MPIISNGIIAYRKHPETKAIEYLMIRRRHTLGLMDFIRGKYSVYNKYYIMNMISQMTVEEKNMLLVNSFDEILANVWDKPLDKPLDKPPGLFINQQRNDVANADLLANPLRKNVCFSSSKSTSADSHSSGSMTVKEMNPSPNGQIQIFDGLNQRRNKMGYPEVSDVNFRGHNLEDAKRDVPFQIFDGLNKWSQCDSTDNRYKSEEVISRDKFNQLKRGIYYDNSKKGKTNSHSTNNMFTQSDQPITPSYSLESIINECQQSWCEPEWGFPKGKRNYNENDIDCAVREFYEETGFKSRNMIFIVNNIAPYEEIFMGSNYKSYKHRYFLMYVDYNTSLTEKMTDTDKLEISKVEWKSFNDCLSAIRPYNLEKKRILSNVNIVLSNCTTTLA
jgi:ADP-ribose pyrophosphatase YjhB (NUDIX family)